MEIKIIKTKNTKENKMQEEQEKRKKGPTNRKKNLQINNKRNQPGECETVTTKMVKLKF